MLAQRLRQLRLARGLSLEALAALMGGIVTKQALSKYETGKDRPSPAVINKLAAALGVKSMDLWAEPTVQVEFVAYRMRSGLARSERERVENLVRESLERRIRLQEMTQQPRPAEIPVRKLQIGSVEEAEQAAARLRALWRLGLDSIGSVTGVIEDHLIHVLEIDASDRFDGISAVACGPDGKAKAAAVVTRRGVPGERQRLSIAHELGHLVLCIPAGIDEEKAAFRFGAAFLAPAEVLHREVGTKRAAVTLPELMLLKRSLGLSIQAILYRLRVLGIISESHYRMWCIDINRQGWKKHEPCELPPERPQWLARNVLRAMSEGLIGREDGERMLGEKMPDEAPLSAIERREFMKLSVDQRRRLLAEQAAKLSEHYEKDPGWREIQGGDLVEY